MALHFSALIACAGGLQYLGLYVCVSFKSNLTSGGSVCPENSVTYSAGNGGQKICGVFTETASLQRSSTASLKAIRTVGHFNAHAWASGRGKAGYVYT